MNNQEKRAPNYTADAVQDFYDSRPYPPPVRDLDSYQRLWKDPQRRRADYHLHFPFKPFREDISILVAGCGTAQAARHAMRYPHAQVVGIDVSATSIEETRILKEKYQLTNLDLRQLPIEQAARLDQPFDKIVCTGVLHHLPDPDAGLHALAKVLKPDGAMQLMVYAAYGRTGVYMMQEYCRRLGIGQSDQEILDLANTLMAMPPEHPLAPLLSASADFRSKAGLADALLHPQDRAYTVPQFLNFVQRAGLVFGRWERQAPYLPQCGELANTPHALRLNRLAIEDQYSAVELFRGTLVRHTAVVYPESEEHRAQPPVGLDGDDCLHYIPIRMPRTICVEKNPPKGAVAVLINQGHTCTDIVLPVNSDQKRVFDAIDGERSIGAIINDTGVEKEKIGQLFRQLWCHDIVVFNASQSAS